MEYKDGILPSYNFGQTAEITEEQMAFAAAAVTLNEIILWTVGQEKCKKEHRAVRMITLEHVMGRLTIDQAAEKAGVNRDTISRNKMAFCELFGVEKKRGDVIRRSE